MNRRILACLLLLALVAGVAIRLGSGPARDSAAPPLPADREMHVGFASGSGADEAETDNRATSRPTGDRSAPVPASPIMGHPPRPAPIGQQVPGATRLALRPDGALRDPVRALDLPLEERIVHPKRLLTLPAGAHHLLSVKFIDAALARFSQPGVLSLSLPEIPPALAELVSTHNLAFEAAFDDPVRLDAVRVRAARRSGTMQADLNGTMLVHNVPPDQTLALARAFQNLAVIESVDLESLDRPPPPPGDLAPTTPDLTTLQDHLGTDPGFGVTFAHDRGITGHGVRLSDCEYGYNPAHEDLVDAAINDQSRAAINPTVYTNNWDEHGTAVAGILVAGDNGYGTLGIAPDCNLHFYSEWTTLGYNRTTAVSDAVMDSEPGDVILLEMQTENGGSGFGPAELNSTVWNLTRTATDSGIIVVGAAGNGGLDLDSATYDYYRNRGDSGAIIVGAGSSTTTHSKRSSSSYGSRVDVQAWGSNVATTGYGGYATYGGDENQSYTASFSGTSSASACVAGVVTLVQSYARTVLHTDFTPAEMRAFLKAHGRPQGGGGGSIGPAVALDLALPELPDRPFLAHVSAANSDDLELEFWGLSFRRYTVRATSNLADWSTLRTGVSGGPTGIRLTLPLQGPAHHNRRYIQVREE